MPLDDHQLESTQERQLGAFADRRATGHTPPPGNDLQETLVHVDDTLGPAFRAATALPAAERQAIWEQIMPASIAPLSHLPTAPGPAARSHPPALRRPLPQWHAVLSLLAVLAFLAAIAGIAYLRLPGDDRGNAGHATLAGQDPGDAADAPPPLQVPAECTTNGGTFTPDEDLRTRSMANWPEPQYTPAQPVKPEIGEAVLDTYLRYSRCLFESMEAMNWAPGTPVTYQDVFSPATISYLSDRYRYGAFHRENLPATEQAAVDAFYCVPRKQPILEGFPLPVNAREDEAVVEQTVDNIPTIAVPVFASSDVYRLPDGRYGAIVGSVGAADLVDWLTGTDTSATPAADGGPLALLFVAFVERDGAYYIDEEFLISGTDNGQPVHDKELQCDRDAG